MHLNRFAKIAFGGEIYQIDRAFCHFGPQRLDKGPAPGKEFQACTLCEK